MAVNGKAPVIKLNSGYDMPVVGLGTYSLCGDTCVNSVRAAIQNGYRLIDTASYYGNEREVGEGIRKSGVPCEEIFPVMKNMIGTDSGNTELKKQNLPSVRRMR